MNRYSLKINKIVQETADCISISFYIPDEHKKFFTYKPGQHLTLIANINGSEVRRSYSLCSIENENIWRVAIKRVDNGVFSNWAHQNLKEGDYIDVLPPQGKFFKETNDAISNILFVAAGSGITPILSILKHTLKQSNTRCTLLYSNKRTDSIIFLEELEALKNLYTNKLQVFHILSKQVSETPLLSGRINDEKLKLFSNLIPLYKFDAYYLCGPNELIDTVRNHLSAQNVDAQKIHFERFGVPAAKLENNIQKIVTTDYAKISVSVDGRKIEFEMEDSEIPILDAAINVGADLPYACKGGVCCTCKAKLIKGSVEMKVHYGLEDDEIKNGYILTCQAYPTAKEIEIDFDV